MKFLYQKDKIMLITNVFIINEMDIQTNINILFYHFSLLSNLQPILNIFMIIQVIHLL